MQGRGDQRKAGLNWTATTRNGEGGDESVVVRREGCRERGGCPCVDGGACPTAGEPCPNLRKPDVSAQPLCPPPLPAEDTAPAPLLPGLFVALSLDAPAWRQHWMSRDRLHPRAPTLAGLRELIVSVAHRCLDRAPLPAPHMQQRAFVQHGPLPTRTRASFTS